MSDSSNMNSVARSALGFGLIIVVLPCLCRYYAAAYGGKVKPY